MPRRPFGSIFRRRSRDGAVLPRFYVRWFGADGKPHVRAAGRTRASAEALLDELRGEKLLETHRRARPDAGRRKDAASLPLATLAPKVLEVWRATLAQGTLRDRRGALGRWARRLGPLPLDAIAQADVEAAVRGMREQGLRASTIRTEVGILSSAFETLRKALRLPLTVNPCRGVLLPPVQARPRPHVPAEDLRRLLEATPEEVRAPLLVMADAGLRPAELFRLTWGEVDLRLGVLRLARTKTYQTRTIPLTARACSVLEQARAVAAPATGTEGGGPPGEGRVFPVSEKRFRKAFREAARAAGLQNAVPYTLRHAYASGLLLEHAPPAVVRDLLGHANIKTTDIYLHSLPGDAARAAVDALERARAAPGSRGAGPPHGASPAPGGPEAGQDGLQAAPGPP